jgi:hypothetical protein
MFYKFLGMAVWNGGKFFLRRKYGRAYMPKPVLAGAGLASLAALGGVVVLAVRHAGSED